MNPLLRTLQLSALLGGLLAPSTRLAAQAVTARAVIAAPKSSVRIGNVRERVHGIWAGVGLDIRVGHLTLSGSGARGQLTGAGAVLEQDAGEVALSGRYEVAAGRAIDLGLDLRYAARAFSSGAGLERWDYLAVGATAFRKLGSPAVRAFASLAYLPMAKVSALEEPSFGLSSDVGVSFAAEGFPITTTLSYRVERFRFPQAAGRSEQFEALTLSVGLRARRRDGRWTLRGSKE